MSGSDWERASQEEGIIMAIRDSSNWPDNKVPDWVLQKRIAQRRAPRLERERLVRLEKIYGKGRKDE